MRAAPPSTRNISVCLSVSQGRGVTSVRPEFLPETRTFFPPQQGRGVPLELEWTRERSKGQVVSQMGRWGKHQTREHAWGYSFNLWHKTAAQVLNAEPHCDQESESSAHRGLCSHSAGRTTQNLAECIRQMVSVFTNSRIFVFCNRSRRQRTTFVLKTIR